METLFDFVKASPTPYQAVEHAKELLSDAGYKELWPRKRWDITPGGKYFCVRNDSSIIAFRVPETEPLSFMLTATHLDTPCFKLKAAGSYLEGGYKKLSAEEYGGAVLHTWIDRPLAVAGRIAVRSERGFRLMNVDTEKPCAVIPGVAIHNMRSINDGWKINIAKDMVAVTGLAGSAGIKKMISDKYGIDEDDILSMDLSLYNPEPGYEFNDIICCPRLDDLQCSYASLMAFLESGTARSIPVCVLFNNEEIGSRTQQGADSTFLYDVLKRITLSLGISEEAFLMMLSGSFMASCDNSHGTHPNYPELADTQNSPELNKGIVIKFNASGHYGTDDLSAAFFRMICDKAGVPTQQYHVRSDMRCGSTLGFVSESHVSITIADVGLAQLSMHSILETAGARDTEYMIKALKVLFESYGERYGHELTLE